MVGVAFVLVIVLFIKLVLLVLLLVLLIYKYLLSYLTTVTLIWLCCHICPCYNLCCSCICVTVFVFVVLLLSCMMWLIFVVDVMLFLFMFIFLVLILLVLLLLFLLSPFFIYCLGVRLKYIPCCHHGVSIGVVVCTFILLYYFTKFKYLTFMITVQWCSVIYKSLLFSTVTYLLMMSLLMFYDECLPLQIISMVQNMGFDIVFFSKQCG